MLRPASLWLLVAPTWSGAASAQQNSMRACNLLTPTELSSAIGGSLGHPTGIFTPKNPRLDRNGDFWSCQEMVGTREVWIFYNTLQVTEEGKKLGQEMQDRLRKQGYDIENKDVGGSHCSTMVPPSGSKSSLVGTDCWRDKGSSHVAVKVGATGANDLFPMEKVAALVEKASSRVASQ